MIITLDIEPMAKPRMTSRDRWAKRPIVQRYNAWKDRLNLEVKAKTTTKDLETFLRSGILTLVFDIPMPSSWSKTKQETMLGLPHRQKSRNDADNLTKSFMDALLEDDGIVWRLDIEKYWSRIGRIIWTI